MLEPADPSFEPLASTEPALADRLVTRYVDRFLRMARLSSRRVEEAKRQLVIEVDVGSEGTRALRFDFPFGGGDPVVIPWDGTEAAAEAIVDFQAEHKAEDVRWDQDNAGPTGWEPEFDDD